MNGFCSDSVIGYMLTPWELQCQAGLSVWLCGGGGSLWLAEQPSGITASIEGVVRGITEYSSVFGPCFGDESAVFSHALVHAQP